MPKANDFIKAVPGLLSWYRENRRALPWREEPSPYRIWVSEVMLQQTRMTAAVPYFLRFIERFPHLRALAEAPLADVLKAWEGLGYYARARNMHKAAGVMQAEYGGIPADYNALLALPGFGRYTAGAVSSMAFSLPYPAVDGNVCRVFARFHADFSPADTVAFRTETEGLAKRAMPESPGEFNQAIMELGALVCKPGTPDCAACPLASGCKALQMGEEAPLSLPVLSKKKARQKEKYTVIVVRQGDAIALRQRPEKGILAGLWEPVVLPGHLSAEQVAAFLQGKGVKVEGRYPLADYRHIFTHMEWHMRGFSVCVQNKGVDGYVFVSRLLRKEAYPMPSAYRPFVKEAEGLADPPGF